MLRDRAYILPKYVKELLNDPTNVFTEQYDGTIFAKKRVYNNNDNQIPKSTKTNSQTTNNASLKCSLDENKCYKKVMIFFSAEKFGVKQLRIKVNKINELRIDHVIFVLDTKFTSHGQRLLNKHVKLEEEIFYFNEMIINPVKHYLVPKYELLTPYETKQFYENVGKKIACVKVSERICRHFNGKIGQIFRIHRQNGPYFRIVVP